MLLDERTTAPPAGTGFGVARPLAEWAHALRWETVPTEIRRLAQESWLDTFGCMLLGAGHAETRALATQARGRCSTGTASAVGGADRLNAIDAVLVNGLATGVHVFDGGNIVSRGHVSGYVMPAVLTAAEIAESTLADAFAAYLVGYEVAARIGAAASLRNEIFTSGTWGVVGAAAAVARLRGFDTSRIEQVIQLAANITLAPSRNATVEGASVRDLYSALPAYVGYLAADLAEAGFRGGPRSIEITFGELSGMRFDAAACITGLGRTWLITDNYTKRYPGCRNFQAAADAIAELLPQLARPFDPDRDAVRAGVDPIGFRDNRAIHTHTSIAARESAPVSLALVLLHGTLTARMFTDGAYEDPRVTRLAERIIIEEAPRARPSDRPGWAEIQQRGAATLRHDVAVPAGGAGNRMPPEELRAKFIANSGGSLGSSAATAADEMISAPGAKRFKECLVRWLGAAAQGSS